MVQYSCTDNMTQFNGTVQLYWQHDMALWYSTVVLTTCHGIMVQYSCTDNMTQHYVTVQLYWQHDTALWYSTVVLTTWQALWYSTVVLTTWHSIMVQYSCTDNMTQRYGTVQLYWQHDTALWYSTVVLTTWLFITVFKIEHKLCMALQSAWEPIHQDFCAQLGTWSNQMQPVTFSSDFANITYNFPSGTECWFFPFPHPHIFPYIFLSMSWQMSVLILLLMCDTTLVLNFFGFQVWDILASTIGNSCLKYFEIYHLMTEGLLLFQSIIIKPCVFTHMIDELVLLLRTEKTRWSEERKMVLIIFVSIILTIF